MTVTAHERQKQVTLTEGVWQKLKIAATLERVSMRELAERAILKELDGKPRK